MPLRWGVPRFSAPRAGAVTPRPLFIEGENTLRKPRATRMFDGSAFKPERAQPPKYVNPFDFLLPDRDQRQRGEPARTDTRAVTLTAKDIKALVAKGYSGLRGASSGLYLEVRTSTSGVTFLTYERVQDFDLTTKKGNAQYMSFLWKYDREFYYEQRRYVLSARNQTRKEWERMRDKYWEAYRQYVQELKSQARKNKLFG